MARLYSLFVALIFVFGAMFASNSDFTVVIDAGHGGRDPGAIRGTIREKTINLAVAKELGRLLENNLLGVKVVYTRKTDVFVELKERAKIANRAKANLFISIHVNSLAAKTTSISGTETYILGLARSAENLAVAKKENAVIKYEEDYTTKYEGFDPDSPESYIIFEFLTNQYMQQSLDIASYIQSEFKRSAKRVDRGVRQAGLLVLRESSMPSILIELGYINNPNEVKYLSSTRGQNALALAIYSGVKKYKIDFDKRTGHAPSKTESAPQDPPSVSSTNTTPITPVKTTTSSDVEYRIQFMYHYKKLGANSPQFKGLKDVTYYQDNGYKYTVGSAKTEAELMSLFREVRKKFKDAFIIQMKDGKRI